MKNGCNKNSKNMNNNKSDKTKVNQAVVGAIANGFMKHNKKAQKGK